MIYNIIDYNGETWSFFEKSIHNKMFQMKKNYSLCHKSICIEAENFPGDNPLWSQFETEGEKADISISCEIPGCFPEMPAESTVRSGEFLVTVRGDKVYREFPMGTVHGALTEYSPADTSFSRTFFTKDSFHIMMDSRYMWSSISLAQLMIFKNAFFIHASYIDIGGKAILFSAPCGTGKSTQAELWRKHRNAEIINGDKAGISADGDVYAHGLPFCGTSGICKNRSLPLGAIVLLGQSKENRIERLYGMQALQGVMSNIYLDLIAPEEQLRCTDLLIEIFESVPVYYLECTPDENAVIALEKALKDGGVI